MTERARVLITNQVLRSATGTEVYVRDLAPQLLRRGWRPIVYTPHPGEVAESLRRLTIPVVDRLERLAVTPDLIHGHHNHPTIAALTHFPDTPAVLFCHDWDAWHDEPFLHPRVRRYVAVDETCRDRLQCLGGIRPERIATIPNWAELNRFRPRDPLPVRPRRALVFSNQTGLGGRRDPFRLACEAEGIEVEVAGWAAKRMIDRPEDVLGSYDLVFAKGKSAMEALAVGAAVVLHGFGRVGPLVTRDRLGELRQQNFGRRAIDTPVTVEALRQRIARYDAADANATSEAFRRDCDIRPTVDRLLDLYASVLEEHRTAPPLDRHEESQAVAAYLQRTQLMVEYGAKRWERKKRQEELKQSARNPLGLVGRLWRRAA